MIKGFKHGLVIAMEVSKVQVEKCFSIIKFKNTYIRHMPFLNQLWTIIFVWLQKLSVNLFNYFFMGLMKVS